MTRSHGAARPTRATGKGRPRAFDADEVLDRALRVFWARGYEGTSLTDLTAAMGINRPSLYAAFGDKRALFMKVVDRYTQRHGAHVEEALRASSARDLFRTLWSGTIRLVAGRREPAGCLLVQGALACASTTRSVQRELGQRRSVGESRIRSRLEELKANGLLDSGCDAGALARFGSAVSYGLSVLAAGGATAAELEAVAAIALDSVPPNRPASRGRKPMVRRTVTRR